MTLAEILINGFISWAVINTVLMLVWIALMWHDGRSAERAARGDAATARQIGGWR